MMSGSGLKKMTQRRPVLFQLVAGGLIICLYLLPHCIFGTNVPMLAHDVLDSEPIQYSQIYQNSSLFWSDGNVWEPMMNGAPLVYNGVNLKLGNFAYYIMPPYGAFVLLQFLTRIVAFLGMWLFLREILRDTKNDVLPLICTGVASLYAVLPHFSPTTFTVPALPLLAWPFVVLARGRARWYHWAVLCTIPFFTSFLMAPIFLLIVIGFLWLFDMARTKRWNGRVFGGLLFASLFYVITEYQMLLAAVLPNETHRVDRISAGTLTFFGSVRLGILNLIHGQYHVATHHKYLLVFFAVVVGLHLFRSARKKAYVSIRSGGLYRLATSPENMSITVTFLALGTAVGISMWYGFYKWGVFAALRSNVPFLDMVQWSRAHWLHPFLWYTALAAACVSLGKFPIKKRYYSAFCIVLLCSQGLYLAGKSNLVLAWRVNAPTWKEFYAEEQFRDIKEYIGLPPETYRVGSVGIFPSVALFNGFYCLDGYSPNYKLSYKRAFRPIIATEIEKTAGQSDPQDLKRYFDEWGSRCYFFSSELGKNYMWTKEKRKVISELAYNWDQFTDLGGRYVLSAVEIHKPEDSGLKLMKAFERPDSVWKIWLYEPM